MQHATIGGAVLLTYVLIRKKTHIIYFLSLLILYALSAWSIPVASAATATIAWDDNTEPGVEGYILYYGTTSQAYLHNVDVGNSTSRHISGIEQRHL